MKKNILLLAVVILLMACHKASDNPPPSPSQATLTFPMQNALCTSGLALSATQSTIVFTWTASANTDSYQIFIKNLLTGTSTSQTVSTNQASIILSRNTPYSWYIVSKSNSVTTTATSDTFKFYVAGTGVTAYAPFPASLITPTFNQILTATNGAINLSWTGADVDNDIAGYDVYMGTTTTPALLKANLTDMFLNGVSVTFNTTYYLKIITRDAIGNTSDSGLIQFMVK